LDLGRGKREQDRDRVVVAWVAVEDDRRAHRASIASSSSVVGSEGCAPAFEAASAPAAQARTSASSRDRPSSSDTTRQAANASPAAVPSIASTRGGRARATSSPFSNSAAPSAPYVTATSAPRYTISYSNRFTIKRSGSMSIGRAGAAFSAKNDAPCW